MSGGVGRVLEMSLKKSKCYVYILRAKCAGYKKTFSTKNKATNFWKSAEVGPNYKSGYRT